MLTLHLNFPGKYKIERMIIKYYLLIFLLFIAPALEHLELFQLQNKLAINSRLLLTVIDQIPRKLATNV